VKQPLTPEMAQQAEALFAAGERRYGDAPVLIGQMRRNAFPEPGGFHLAVIAAPQATGRRIKRLLEKELQRLHATLPKSQQHALNNRQHYVDR
jgi:hypothetical protein